MKLVFPPQFEPFQPYLAGPYLSSFLSSAGASVATVDENLGFYDWLVSLADQVTPWALKPSDRALYLRKNVGVAVRGLKSVPTAVSSYRWAVDVVDDYLGAISPPGVGVGLAHLDIANPLSSSDLAEYVADPGNLFSLYFEQASERILGPSAADCYLISAVVIDQLAAAVVFARHIRQHRPGATIALGGPLVSSLHQQLARIPWITQAFDSIVAGQAREAVPRAFGLPPIKVSHVRPDFSDLDLDRYWSCRRVLPYLVSHGCQWGRCAFCSHHLGYGRIAEPDMAQVVADLEHMVSAYDCEYVSFSDEYLAPAQLMQLADRLKRREVDIKWSTFARAEPRFRDDEFLHELYGAGCRVLMFGLESASQRVLNSMGKGTRADDYRPILEACREANIAVRCDFMIGFPGEEEEDVEKTYAFLDENRDVLDTPFSSHAIAVFELREGAPVMRNAQQFGVKPRRRLRGDLDDQWAFEELGGLSGERKLEWRSRMIRLLKTEFDAELVCPQNKTHQLVLKDLSDQGLVGLPPTDVSPPMWGCLTVRLARGVVLTLADAELRITNRASGGVLTVGSELSGLFHSLTRPMALEEAFDAQDVWPRDTFAKLIDVLYRSDYVVVSRAGARSACTDRQ